MKLPQIRMTSQMAQIHNQQMLGVQENRQTKADMSIQQTQADVLIKMTPAKLHIDQTKAWEDMNLMSISRRIEKFAQEGYQASLEGTKRRAEQGRELMEIEHAGKPLVQQAKENAFDDMKRLGVQFIPSRFAVYITYIPAEVKIDVKPNKPIIKANPQQVKHRYHKGNVFVDMQQYAQLDIDVVHLFSESV